MYSPVSKTSVQVSIRLIPSEPHKPGFEENKGAFKARNLRSASFISSPIRSPRNSNTGRGIRAGGKTVNEKSGTLRPKGNPEPSGAAGICAKTDSDRPRIKAPRRTARREQRMGSMSEPSFLSVAQRNRREGLGAARKGDGEMRKGPLKPSPLPSRRSSGHDTRCTAPEPPSSGD